MRRQVAVEISEKMLRTLITEGHETQVRCVKGIPAGAQFVGMYREARAVTIVYEHPTLDEVPPGSDPPLVKAEFDGRDAPRHDGYL